MRIDSYSFGTMEIEGVQYRGDIIIYPDKIRSNWYRRLGHTLNIEDLTDVLNFGPEILVIGTGALGKMEVPAEVTQSLNKKGIEVIAQMTGQAWDIFNQLVKQGKKVVGIFHLTC